jgi:hypothetical protein
MTKVSTLLIVTMLAGSPVTAMACIGACEKQLTRAATCDRDMSASADPTMKRADCGTALVNETAFLKEERIPDDDAWIVISVWTTSKSAMASGNAVAITSPIAIAWPTTGHVLRL